jgi:Transposase IS116/IS110/IS902 family
VSSEHSTGEKQNRGAITRAGDRRLRNKLIQSAWVTIRKDPELREFHRRVHPGKILSRPNSLDIVLSHMTTCRRDSSRNWRKRYIAIAND